MPIPLFLYQQSAEPVSLAGEFITIDKWLPIFADFAVVAERAPHLTGGMAAMDFSVAVASAPVTDVSWLPYFPDFALAAQRQPHLEGGGKDPYASQANFAIPDLSWLPNFPDRIDVKEHHPAYNPPLAFQKIEETTDVSQFAALYQRHPDFAWALMRAPHLVQSFHIRETPRPGVWTEPGTDVITTSWTEPAIAASSTTWTEPGVTPVLPSPDVP